MRPFLCFLYIYNIPNNALKWYGCLSDLKKKMISLFYNYNLNHVSQTETNCVNWCLGILNISPVDGYSEREGGASAMMCGHTLGGQRTEGTVQPCPPHRPHPQYPPLHLHHNLPYHHAKKLEDRSFLIEAVSNLLFHSKSQVVRINEAVNE